METHCDQIRSVDNSDYYPNSAIFTLINTGFEHFLCTNQPN